LSVDALARLMGRTRPLALFAVVAASALAAWGASRLEIDDVPSNIFRSQDAEFERLESVFRDFGTDDNDVLLVVHADDLFTPEAARALRALTAEVGAVPGVLDVHAFADVPVFDGGPVPRPLLPPGDAQPAAFEAARAAARAHPLVHEQLLAPDGRTTLCIARLAGEHLPIATLHERMDALEAAVARATEGGPLRVRLTGVPAIRVVIFDTISREQALFSLAGGVLGALVGFFVFRRILPVLITSSASVLAGFWALGGLGLVGQPLNIMTAELPLLIMVIAFTDAVHLMIDVLRQRRAGAAPLTASAHALRYLGLACLLTSLTTAVGFGSLAVSRVEVIRRFGVLFAASVGLAFLAVVTIVPLFASLIPARSEDAPPELRFSRLAAPVERMLRALLRRARAVSIAVTVATAALVLVSLQLVPDNRLTEATPSGDEAVEVLGELEQAFGGAVGAAVLVEWQAGGRLPPGLGEVLAAVDAELARSPFTHGPLSMHGLARLVPGATIGEAARVLPAPLTRRFLRQDLGRALVTCRVPDAGSAVAEPAYLALERALALIEAGHQGFALHLTGTGYVARRNVNLIIEDFRTGLWIAALFIFAVLSLAFRSLRLGLVSVIPNAFPLALAGAALVVAGLELQVSSVLAFTVCLGLAVDDTIHFVIRYRRELAACGDPEEAALRACMAVGRALGVTTCVLVAGFAVLFASSIATTVLFGLIATIGLVAALVSDLVFLPALLVAFGGDGRGPTAAA
jgi:hypothetical protein